MMLDKMKMMVLTENDQANSFKQNSAYAQLKWAIDFWTT